MKKKNITLVFVAIVFSIIVGMIIGKSLLKHKEGEPDVVGSFSMNRDENLTVVANRKNISDKEAFTRLLPPLFCDGYLSRSLVFDLTGSGICI